MKTSLIDLKCKLRRRVVICYYHPIELFSLSEEVCFRSMYFLIPISRKVLIFIVTQFENLRAILSSVYRNCNSVRDEMPHTFQGECLKHEWIRGGGIRRKCYRLRGEDIKIGKGSLPRWCVYIYNQNLTFIVKLSMSKMIFFWKLYAERFLHIVTRYCRLKRSVVVQTFTNTSAFLTLCSSSSINVKVVVKLCFYLRISILEI